MNINKIFLQAYGNIIAQDGIDNWVNANGPDDEQLKNAAEKYKNYKQRHFYDGTEFIDISRMSKQDLYRAVKFGDSRLEQKSADKLKQRQQHNKRYDYSLTVREDGKGVGGAELINDEYLKQKGYMFIYIPTAQAAKYYARFFMPPAKNNKMGWCTASQEQYYFNVQHASSNMYFMISTDTSKAGQKTYKINVQIKYNNNVQLTDMRNIPGQCMLPDSGQIARYIKSHYKWKLQPWKTYEGSGMEITHAGTDFQHVAQYHPQILNNPQAAGDSNMGYFLLKNPDMLNTFTKWDKLSGNTYAKLFRKYGRNRFINKVPYDKFSGADWVYLLHSYPDEVCNLDFDSLSQADKNTLIINMPHMFLDNIQPQTLTPEMWATMLINAPDLADEYQEYINWDEINDGDFDLLTKFRPQFRNMRR